MKNAFLRHFSYPARMPFSVAYSVTESFRGDMSGAMRGDVELLCRVSPTFAHDWRGDGRDGHGKIVGDLKSGILSGVKPLSESVRLLRKTCAVNCRARSRKSLRMSSGVSGTVLYPTSQRCPASGAASAAGGCRNESSRKTPKGVFLLLSFAREARRLRPHRS